MKKNGKLELLEVLPRKDKVFVCEDPGRMDIYGKPMDDVHIEVRRDHLQVWYFCYGCLLEDFSRVCFGAEMSMEGACKVIAELIPCCSSADEQERFNSEHPAPEEINTESKNMICHAAAEGVSMEALPCAGDAPADDCCDGCQYLDEVINQIVCDGCACTDCNRNYCGDPDADLERQKLKAQVRYAYLNGGRTGYLYDIDGNEYYVAIDGRRHYTRVEG